MGRFVAAAELAAENERLKHELARARRYIVEPAFKYNGPIIAIGNQPLMEKAMQEDPPKVYMWFEEKPAGTWLCIEFHGGFVPNAPWYKTFWRRLRMELGAEDPTASTGWQQGQGGLAGKVWRLNLASDALRATVDVPTAHQAVINTVNALNAFPHRVGLLLEVI